MAIPTPPGDPVIFEGGTILTMRDAKPEVTAMAVADGRVVAVGEARDVRAAVGTAARVVNLQGDTLMPGAVEPHSHPLLGVAQSTATDVSAFTCSSAKEVMDALRAAGAAADSGEFLAFRGYDPIAFRELGPLPKDRLDALFPNNPVLVVTQMAHLAFANSAALAAANLKAQSPEPGGGRLGRNPDGTLTGLLHEESAIFAVGILAMAGVYQDFGGALGRVLKGYSRAGYTTASCPLIPVVPDFLGILQGVVDAPMAPIRMFTYLKPEFIDSYELTPGAVDNNLSVNGVKFWADGSPFAGNIALREPYLNTPLTRGAMGLPENCTGSMNYEPRQLYGLMEKYHKAGWQIMVHAQGDRTFDVLLNLFEELHEKYPRKDARHRVEHCALADERHFERMAALGMIPSFYPDHIYYYGNQLRDEIMGPERASRWMAAAWAKKQGLPFTYHTDAPISFLTPFLHSAQTAMTRKTRASGEVIGPEQSISVDDALRAYTVHGAVSVFDEKNRGSFEVGKIADGTRLSANPRDVPASQWSTDIAVKGTFRGGLAVHD
ncbi:MAG: amidohydrolase [Polyangiaceae bacterium]|nr:amidohydrolase [Polyangiaceae bacterium]